MNNANLVKKRYAAERRFKAYGLGAIAITAAFLAFLLIDLVSKAIPAVFVNEAILSVTVDPSMADPANPIAGDYLGMTKKALQANFPEITTRADKKALNGLLSAGAADVLQARVIADPSLIGQTITVPVALDSNADLYLRGTDDGQLSDKQKELITALKDKGLITHGIAWNFFLNGDSREPELAGIKGALIGSIFTILITLSIALPLGVAAALYLEEFARKNWITDVIEININNLAAVPSIIFGLLGLAVFLNAFGIPRSTPLVGGLVLSLLVLPTIIIASRAAIKSVPPSIKEAALGVGASHVQAVFHHVLPLAVPGILTGTILGVARALGETAPLLMIGMIAFIVDVPGSVTDAATVLPVQVFLWSDLPEAAFQSRTAAAIIVLLVVLFAFNALAIYLRKRFERRW
ncbi:phosphate ABC transporter permease PstA [Aestuariivirga sp.]|uniref:phosphate ABC transporter permease PstA n=1 Tax=Aestuariivirga sp. TaxID=2650926 RepID=UPI0039E4A6F7